MLSLDILVGLSSNLRCLLKLPSTVLFVTAFALNHVSKLKVLKVAGNVVNGGSCFASGVEWVSRCTTYNDYHTMTHL